MLTRYREELERPIQEAAEFFSRVETQLDSLAGEYFIRLFSTKICSLPYWEMPKWYLTLWNWS
jgi:hypothetical protein